MHPLLKENEASKVSTRWLNLISDSITTTYDLEGDGDIAAVMKELSSHLTTMNTNLKDMKDLRVWINRAEGALGEILQRLEGFDGIDHVYGAEVA